MTAENAIKIERIRLGELSAFADAHRDDHQHGGVVPISALRAAAQVHNPAACEDDLALLVACRGDICVGYLGLMPGWVRVQGLRKTVYWFTTWYVPPALRQTGVGALLMLQAMRLDRDVIANGIAPETLAIYRRLRFELMGPLQFERFDARRIDLFGLPWLVCTKLLKRRGLQYPWLDSVFQPMRSISLRAVYAFLPKAARRFEEDYDFEISNDPAVELSRPQRSTAFERSHDIVRWMLDRPWLTDKPEDATPGYFFSDLCVSHETKVVRFRSKRDSGEGWVVLRTLRRDCETTCKVLDYGLPPDGGMHPVVAAGLREACRRRADIIEMPREARRCLDESALLRRLFRTRERPLYCHLARQGSVLRDSLRAIALDYCDGDTPFT